MKKPRPARQAIRDVAIELFSEKGYAATTTREICQRAGVTKPVLYYYFGSKEQLFREVVLDACNEARKQLLLAAGRARSAPGKLVEMLASDFELTRKNPGLSLMSMRLIFAPPKESPGIDYIQLGREWIGLLAEVVREGVSKGEMQGRPREIAEALLGILLIYSLGHLLAGEPELDRRLARRIVNLLLKGCGGYSTDR
jgi:AcrR family transcriptional regulator